MVQLDPDQCSSYISCTQCVADPYCLWHLTSATCRRRSSRLVTLHYDLLFHKKCRPDGSRRSCYNRCIKIFFGYSRRDSLTNILFNLGLPSFDTLLTNAAVTFARLWSSCTNRIVNSYAFASALSVLCLTFTLVYSFPSVSFCVFLCMCVLFSRPY